MYWVGFAAAWKHSSYSFNSSCHTFIPRIWTQRHSIYIILWQLLQWNEQTLQWKLSPGLRGLLREPYHSPPWPHFYPPSPALSIPSHTGLQSVPTPFSHPTPLHLLFLLPEGSMSDFFSSIRPQLHISTAKRLSLITQQKLGLLKLQRTHKKKLFYFFPSTCFPIYCILPSLKYKLDQYPCSYLNYPIYHFISITWYHIWRRRVHKKIFFGMVRSMFLHESNWTKCLRLF